MGITQIHSREFFRETKGMKIVNSTRSDIMRLIRADGVDDKAFLVQNLSTSESMELYRIMYGNKMVNVQRKQ